MAVQWGWDRWSSSSTRMIAALRARRNRPPPAARLLSVVRRPTGRTLPGRAVLERVGARERGGPTRSGGSARRSPRDLARSDRTGDLKPARQHRLQGARRVEKLLCRTVGSSSAHGTSNGWSAGGVVAGRAMVQPDAVRSPYHR